MEMFNELIIWAGDNWDHMDDDIRKKLEDLQISKDLARIGVLRNKKSYSKII